jgi:1-acyl-sn-glycerol-3-phosphate acyltransferase
MATKLLHSLFGVFWLIFVPTLIFVANIQIIFLLPVLFISRRLFRRAAGLVGDLLWPGLAWSFEVFNNNPIKFYGEEVRSRFSSTCSVSSSLIFLFLPFCSCILQLPYGESTLVLANHSFHCDFIVVFALAFRCRMLGMYRMVLKNAIRYIPAVGTALGGG